MQRLDSSLVKRGLALSRQQAKRLIKSGYVLINDRAATKPAQPVDEADQVIVLANDSARYVSRAGFKLERALNVFQVDVNAKICLDIGASTGGFTDCLLQRGAAKVYALDVGHDQLANKLRLDKRVVEMSGTNIRHVTTEDFDQPIDLICVDVSFISLALVLPVIRQLCNRQTIVICLIKPQFEVGKQAIGKGVVKSAKLHNEVLLSFVDHCKNSQLNVRNISFSSIKGNKGNIEFIAIATTADITSNSWSEAQINKIVNQCYQTIV